jgi:hypothetical protein
LIGTTAQMRASALFEETGHENSSTVHAGMDAHKEC